MARQKGIFKLQGTIGGVSFYRSRDGYLAREKGGVDGDRIKNDPAFARTRENGNEFGRAGKGGKLVRLAFRNLLQSASDSLVTSRMTQKMMKVVRSDQVNGRGERTVQDGDLSPLIGFDFNIKAKLGATLFVPYTQAIDRAAGTLQVDIPAFVPETGIAAPAGSTHFKLVAGAAELDFADESFQVDVQEGGMVAYGNQLEAASALAFTLPAGSTLPYLLVVGVNFYQDVNGTMYSLKNNAFNTLGLIAVDMV